MFDEPVGCLGSLVETVVPSARKDRLRHIRDRFAASHAEWASIKAELLGRHQAALDDVADANRRMTAEFDRALAEWTSRLALFRSEQASRNDAIDLFRTAYLAGDPDEVVRYCDRVLDHSSYPDWCPKAWELEYRPDAKLLIVQYQLPTPDEVPRIKQVRYVASRDAFEETTFGEAPVKKAYDSALYQIALRTVHELFTADEAGALDAIAFNGQVRPVDPATGKEIDRCLMTFQVAKEEFAGINLAAVEPKACFRKLKGIAAAQLHALVAVPPVVQLSTEDERFVDQYAVRSTLDEGENLAAMDWEDFEHLIRELFEAEFAKTGGEAKVTRASRDGGVDVVAFDPTPLRGGKIVIQAKRYTNTVGVNAVRELYGTVVNEGAIKGILVTTAQFGPDAYEFARAKPLELIDGGKLLFLLQQHGHRVRIDLMEAKNLTKLSR